MGPPTARRRSGAVRMATAAVLCAGILVVLRNGGVMQGQTAARQAAQAQTAGGLGAAAAAGAKLPPFPELDSDPLYCSRLRSVLPRVPPELEVPTTANYTEEAAAAGVGQLKRLKLRSGLKYGGQPYSMYLYSDDKDVVSSIVGASGGWEQNLVGGIHQQLTAFAKEKGLPNNEVYFMDFGGNLGAFTLAIAAAGFRVITFEALYSNYLAIKLSICSTPHAEERVTLVNKGIGNNHTTCLLFSPLDNIGNGMVRCGEPPSVPHEKRAFLEIVRLDELLEPVLPALKGRVGAIKLDIEGYEPLAVEGGDQFFREVAPPYIVTEVVEEFIIGSTGKPAREWLKEMARRGYKVFNEGQQPIAEQEMETWSCVQCTVYFKL
ncbi:hypothetical protein ABPG75_009812 [Micractinium tetrahymenae]